MKKILCYGDSNTFGYVPSSGERYDETERWTGILQTILGNEYKIIEEGACDRTGFVNNPKGYLFSAPRHFPKLISKTSDIDILILSIGTNDLQFQYDISYGAIERGLEVLIVDARKNINNIILIPPVVLEENILDGFFKIQFDETSVIKSKKAGKIYKKLAGVYGCKFFDTNEFVHPSPKDGLHYDKEGHRLIAQKLAEFIKKNFD